MVSIVRGTIINIIFFNWPWLYFARVVLISHAQLLSTCPKPVWPWKSELNGLAVPANTLLVKRGAQASTGASRKENGPGLSAFITLQALRSHSLAFTYSCLMLPQTNHLSPRAGQLFPQTICRQTNAATREHCNEFRA